ncbi:tetratricopeptide repeat protein [Olivibacter sitiensis]|uniref:tetratricopeptide repeat protein n=1 Tax=Olivibacter sitiensis TaxID=376470 RepID=UPI00040CA1CB|nr:tetratricopeptide repeat protein [Olivibacter sitiensis]
MLKKITRLSIVIGLFSNTALAQQSAWQELNQAYKTGMELYERGKYAAAFNQFGKVEEQRTQTTQQEDEKDQISLIKEDARFYQAVCALELGNEDAESLFLRFIKDHPTSSNTKAAYFQVGRSYFGQKNYKKTLEWFDKLDGGGLSGGQAAEYRFKKAYSHFMEQQYAEAKPLFERQKDNGGKYQEASIYYYAYIAYLDGEYKVALKEFERLKGSKTYESSYPYYIAALYFLDKRYDDVLAYILPILKATKQENETEIFRIVGATYFAKNDLQNADVYYTKFQQQDQGKTQNNQDDYQIGYIAYKKEDYEKAIKELEKLSDADAYYQSGMILLGDAFIKTGNKQSARNAFFKASKLDFDSSMKEQGLLNYAKLSYELEFHQVALDATQEYLKTYPRSAHVDEAKTLLAEVLLSTKNYKAAIDILESIPKRNADANTAYQKVTYFRGLEYYNERAFENSISTFMRAESFNYDQEIKALATYWKAEAMYEVRKYAEATTAFEQFLRNPAAKNTDVYNYANYALAYAAFRSEQYQKAATYLERFLNSGEGIELNTKNDAIARLGDSYFMAKNYGRAMQQYDKLIERKAKSQDYALFQRGIIQGLEGRTDEKIATLTDLLARYPQSNYADDASFEIPYTYFLTGENEIAIKGLQDMIEKYPRSSYVPRALITIGLVQYNSDQTDAALSTFKRVVEQYPTTEEAKQALKSIQNVYIDRGDANGFLSYAQGTNIGNLTTAEQDNITFQVAHNYFIRGDYEAAIEAINAYFDKFPKPIQEKFARFIRGESYYKTGKPTEAIHDFNVILNDWTSPYTERTLISVSNMHLGLKRYNEAIAPLKKLELTSEYKENYGFAIQNLMICYFQLNDFDEAIKYAGFVKNYEKSSLEDKVKASLYAGKAYMLKGDLKAARKELEFASTNSQTIVGAEAKYNFGVLLFEEGEYKKAQDTAFDLIKNMPSYDYWVAKSFILLADTYEKLKDNFQAKSTLQSVIDNYEGDDDILPTAKARLKKLNEKK